MQNGLDGYRRWLEGDREAFSETVIAYNKKLIYYIGGLTGRFGDAEDLASEVFLRLLVKKPRFKEEEQLSSWLYKTARNLSLDALRKRKTEPAELDGEAAEEAELADALIASEEQRALHTALSALTPDYRDVLILLYFGELSYERAAAVMKKNTAQIRNLAFRAKKSLREKLERMDFHHED
ncbi:MAG: RNA polymerase sigma factor [Clostridia bacterium]|nr:RNA polymerase sigma factor [Clostridia bacterium]